MALWNVEYDQKFRDIETRLRRLENIKPGGGISMQSGPGGIIIGANNTAAETRTAIAKSDKFYAKITANNPTYTFTEVILRVSVKCSQVDGTNQRLEFENVTGGTFSLAMGEYTFESINYNVSNEDLELIIEGILLQNSFTGGATVTGGPCPGNVNVEFEDTGVPLMVATSNDLTGDGQHWSVKNGGRTGTATNLAEIEQSDPEEVPVNSIVMVYLIKSGGKTYYMFSRDIGSEASPETLPGTLFEIGHQHAVEDTDYWRSEITSAVLDYNISNLSLQSVIQSLIYAAGFIGDATASEGPAPSDVLITFVDEDVPLLDADASIQGSVNVSCAQIDDTHQWIKFGGNVAGGTFSLAMGEYTFESIDYNVNNEDLELIIEGLLLQNSFTGGATVTGGPCPGNVNVEFEDTGVPLMVANSNDLTGNVTLQFTQVTSTSQLLEFGGDITGGTFTITMPGHENDNIIHFLVPVDMIYTGAADIGEYEKDQLFYVVRKEVKVNGKTTYIGPESDPILIAESMECPCLAT